MEEPANFEMDEENLSGACEQPAVTSSQPASDGVTVPAANQGDLSAGDKITAGVKAPADPAIARLIRSQQRLGQMQLPKTLLDLDACKDVVTRLIIRKGAEASERRSSPAGEPPKPIVPIDSYRSAAPCSMAWAGMKGGERVRFCERCQKQVYDLRSLERSEANRLIFQREQKEKYQLFRRNDGTFMTADCPVGVARRRSLVLAGISLAVVAAAGIWLTFTAPVPPKPKEATDQAVTKVVKKSPAVPVVSPVNRVFGGQIMGSQSPVPPTGLVGTPLGSGSYNVRAGQYPPGYAGLYGPGVGSSNVPAGQYPPGYVGLYGPGAGSSNVPAGQYPAGYGASYNAGAGWPPNPNGPDRHYVLVPGTAAFSPADMSAPSANTGAPSPRGLVSPFSNPTVNGMPNPATSGPQAFKPMAAGPGGPTEQLSGYTFGRAPTGVAPSSQDFRQPSGGAAPGQAVTGGQGVPPQNNAPGSSSSAGNPYVRNYR